MEQGGVGNHRLTLAKNSQGKTFLTTEKTGYVEEVKANLAPPNAWRIV